MNEPSYRGEQQVKTPSEVTEDAFVLPVQPARRSFEFETYNALCEQFTCQRNS